jgi:hypothetical protein
MQTSSSNGNHSDGSSNSKRPQPSASLNSLAAHGVSDNRNRTAAWLIRSVRQRAHQAHPQQQWPQMLLSRPPPSLLSALFRCFHPRA